MHRHSPPPIDPKPKKPAPHCCDPPGRGDVISQTNASREVEEKLMTNDRRSQTLFEYAKDCGDRGSDGMDPLPRTGIGPHLAGEWPKLKPAGARGTSGSALFKIPSVPKADPPVSPPPSTGGFAKPLYSPPPPPSTFGFAKPFYPPPPPPIPNLVKPLYPPPPPPETRLPASPAEPLKNSSLGTSLPSTWVPMPRDENGNDFTVYSTKVPPEGSENQEVEKLFQRTAKASSMTIISVERIQNPYLYQVYQMRKQKMDNDNRGNNERRLFHGTHPDNLSKINTQGFNRSFSGLAHGTRLGKGVYFARDASFAKSYASGGDRFMYLARVLVGQYCKGDPTMVVPPPKDPSRPEILFDSVVDQKENPKIFVVFFDNQCYPEYLIRFHVAQDI